VASLLEQLEGELGAEAKPATGQPARTGDGLFTRANRVDTIAVLDWMGVPHESTPRGEMAQCPGCLEDGALVGEDGGLKCLHDRCASDGVPGKRGFRTNTDIVAKLQNLSPEEAAKLICQRFGVERPKPERAKATPAAKREEVQPPEPNAREPGDDADELPTTGATVISMADVQSGKVPAHKRLGLLSIQELLGMVYAELQKEKPQRGVPTGNCDLDDAIGGFRRGNITVFGAKRSMGKTSFSINAADVALAAGHKVVLLAGEDSAMMYGKRWMARRANLNAMRIRDLEANKYELTDAANAFADAPSAPFFLPVAGRPVEWLASALRDLRKDGPIDLVIADYLQCIRTGDKVRAGDRRGEVTHVMKVLVEVIREIGAAGLLLSQLKRTERVRPEIEDLKESGDIEDMADHVVLGFKEESEGSVRRMLILAKNKDGIDDIDDIQIEFDPKTANFKPTAGRHYTKEPGQWDDFADNSEERFP
jgi:hypothetical protein